MIELEVRVTGSELGRKLAQDEEELAYALVELSEHDVEGLDEVVDYISTEGSETIPAWLRKLADMIENGGSE